MKWRTVPTGGPRKRVKRRPVNGWPRSSLVAVDVAAIARRAAVAADALPGHWRGAWVEDGGGGAASASSSSSPRIFSVALELAEARGSSVPLTLTLVRLFIRSTRLKKRRTFFTEVYARVHVRRQWFESKSTEKTSGMRDGMDERESTRGEGGLYQQSVG